MAARLTWTRDMISSPYFDPILIRHTKQSSVMHVSGSHAIGKVNLRYDEVSQCKPETSWPFVSFEKVCHIGKLSEAARGHIIRIWHGIL